MCIYNCSLWQLYGACGAGHSLGGIHSNLAHELSRRVKVFVVVDVELLLLALDHLFGDVAVGALQTQNHGLGELVLLVSLDDRSSESVAAQDASENVNEDRLHFSVVVQQLQSHHESLALS